MAKNFYTELFHESMAKVATDATAKEVKASLEGLDNDQMEALAEEIRTMVKTADEVAPKETSKEDPKEKETDKARQEEGAAEKELKVSAETTTADGTKDQGAVEAKGKSEAEATAGEKRIDKDDDKKKEAVDATVPADAKKDDAEYASKSSSEVLESILKEGAAAEAEIQKMAYIHAEEIMKTAGFGVADYVFAKVGNEKIATLVAEHAEKLAFVNGVSSFAVADDILRNMEKMVSE